MCTVRTDTGLPLPILIRPRPAYNPTNDHENQATRRAHEIYSQYHHASTKSGQSLIVRARHLLNSLKAGPKARCGSWFDVRPKLWVMI